MRLIHKEFGPNSHKEDELKLAEFRLMYARWSQQNFLFDFFLYSFLLWFENKYLDARRQLAVEKAIAKYHQQMDELEPSNEPIYSEEPSNVPGFPTIRLTNPVVK